MMIPDSILPPAREDGRRSVRISATVSTARSSKNIGKPFTAREGNGLNCENRNILHTRPKVANDGGRADID